MDDVALLLHFGDRGIRGSEVCLIQSARAFAGRGYTVVICRNHPVMDDFLNQTEPRPILVDLQFPEIMMTGWKDSTFPVLSYLRTLKQLYRIVKQYRPSLMYCNSGLPCQIGVPVGRLCHVPVLCHFHHPATKRYYYIWLVALANRLIFPSRFTRDHTYSKCGVSGDVVYNGIDLNRFRPAGQRDRKFRFALGIDENAIVIGQIAQLVEHKRQDFLIRAFASLAGQSQAPVHLCLVGKGPMEASLRNLALSLGIEDRVSITGHVEDVLPYYQHVFDINVLASREEGLGISVIEGSACALPAIVTRCTGLRETVVENTTGLAFDMDDMDGLTEKLLCLVNNPAIRLEMGSAGRAHAERIFSADDYNQGVVRAAENMLRDYSLQTGLLDRGGVAGYEN